MNLPRANYSLSIKFFIAPVIKTVFIPQMIYLYYTPIRQYLEVFL